MKALKYASLFSLMLAMGCSRGLFPSNNNTQNASVNERVAPEELPFVTYPTEVEIKEEPVEFDTENIIAPVDIKRLQIVVDDFDFSENEKKHTSISDYDPFGEDSILHVELTDGRFSYPMDGKLMSPYGPRGGRMHSGSDLDGERGDPIYALSDGVVRMSTSYGAYGKIVTIRHYNGLESVYSHNTENFVKVGDLVKAGQRIATCGSTGNARGTHLHFEIRVAGITIDPAHLLNFETKTIHEGSLVIKKTGPKAITVLNSELQKKQAAQEQTQKASTEAVYHTIVSGNTLSALARRYGTTVNTICRLNNITPTTILKLGRKLRMK